MKNKDDNQLNSQVFISKSENIGTIQNPISSLIKEGSEQQQNNQNQKNVFIQKNNLISDSDNKTIQKINFNEEKGIKDIEKNDTGSDIYMKSPNILNSNINQIGKINNNEQFICKKMSLDLDDDITNSNVTNKKSIGCNCKNSGCLKRYCECFSRMKYCDETCQCKNCINNVKYEKERAEAIKLYLVKSPVSFKKINMDLNNIACNCKKSNCLKNYCECYQYNLKCTYSCGCTDCKNRNLLEKKLFHVENNYNKTKNNNNNINNDNQHIIQLQEEEMNVNNINNSINNNINNINKTSNKKIINNPQFIINKNINNNNINISPSKVRNRPRYFSFDDDISQTSQWNNLNLKKIEISNQKLIIDNYNVNQPENIPILYQGIQNNAQNTNINGINTFNNIINIRKNSAFNAIIK